MVNKHYRMIIAGFFFLIGSTYSSLCQGQIRLGQTYILIYGSFDGDNIRVNQWWNGDISVTIRENRPNGRIKFSGDIRHNPERKYLYVMGLDGEDQITTDTSIDNIIYGGNGNDSIRADGDSNCYIFGGNGNDDISTGGANTSYAYGENGDDEITLGNDGPSYAYGDDGDDDIWGYSDWNFIDGGNGDDCLIGVNRGQDTVYGRVGNDFIATGLGFDKIFAGTGSDLVYIVSSQLNQHDMGPLEANPLAYANPSADYFPLEKWAYWYQSVYLTQLLAPIFNGEAIIMPEGGYWKQG